ALQQGLPRRTPQQSDEAGRAAEIQKNDHCRRAFDRGYYPVSRLVSTFPSSSDVAWTEILANDPLPGYQRSFFDIAANQAVSQSGISTTVEYESQMHSQIK